MNYNTLLSMGENCDSNQRVCGTVSSEAARLCIVEMGGLKAMV